MKNYSIKIETLEYKVQKTDQKITACIHLWTEAMAQQLKALDDLLENPGQLLRIHGSQPLVILVPRGSNPFFWPPWALYTCNANKSLIYIKFSK